MEKLRLGGMALQNGVLVHGPKTWGAAVRLPDGTVKTASGTKPRIALGESVPFVRGPVRLAEAFAVLPAMKRVLPEAKLPFERPAVAVALVAASTSASLVRRSSLPLLPREAAVVLASLVPVCLIVAAFFISRQRTRFLRGASFVTGLTALVFAMAALPLLLLYWLLNGVPPPQLKLW